MKEELLQAMHNKNFWAAVIGGVINIANAGFNLHIPAQDVVNTSLIIISYILGNAVMAHGTVKDKTQQ